MKIKSLIFIVLLFICNSSIGQDSSSYVIIRIHEGRDLMGNFILATRNGKIVDTERLDPLIKDGGRQNNQTKIHNFLVKYFTEGYKIMNSVSGGNKETIITTYICTKE